MLTHNSAAPLLLIVEGDDNHANQIRHSLQDAQEEYRVETVRTLHDAWGAIQRHNPDLILTDYPLPDGDANELVVRVKETCPIIVMTAEGNEQLAVHTIKAGAQDYISKSHDALDSLPQTVKGALQEWYLSQERKKIYQAVSRGKREWELTFDAVPDLILIIDNQHTISRVNRALADRCGFKPEELPGRKCYEIFHNRQSPPVFCPFVRLLKDGGEQTEEIEEKNLAGFFDITVSPLYNNAGSLTACVHVARDVTARNKAEEERLTLEQQLQQAQKLESLGVLSGGIAHDFNNILTIILGHCFLARDEIDPESSKSHLKQIEAAATRAADLCRQMLAYAGKSPMVQVQINLPQLVDETVVMLRPSFKKNVSIEPCLRHEVPEFAGDKAKIQQIAMNLIVNAVEAIGADCGTVRIGVSDTVVQTGDGVADFTGNAIAAGPYVCLEVSDTGCGMDEETRSRIFEPFFSTKFTGRGLGLSALIGIMKSHHGALQLSSTLGVGTTFKVYFPLTANANHPQMPQTSSMGTAAKFGCEDRLDGTILLVDDEDELLRIGKRMLTSMGFSVITASNGREALETYSAKTSAIQLIMMDLTMPEMDGIEAYYELRKVALSVPIVICSGYGKDAIPSAISNDVHVGFVPKPYRAEQVRNMLRRLLDNPE